MDSGANVLTAPACPAASGSLERCGQRCCERARQAPPPRPRPWRCAQEYPREVLVGWGEHQGTEIGPRGHQVHGSRQRHPHGCPFHPRHVSSMTSAAGEGLCARCAEGAVSEWHRARGIQGHPGAGGPEQGILAGSGRPRTAARGAGQLRVEHNRKVFGF